MKQTPFSLDIHYVNNTVDIWHYETESDLEQAYQKIRDYLFKKNNYGNSYFEFPRTGKLVNLDNVIFIEKKIITP